LPLKNFSLLLNASSFEIKEFKKIAEEFREIILEGLERLADRMPSKDPKLFISSV